MRRIVQCLGLYFALLTLFGCANLGTISRTTELPPARPLPPVDANAGEHPDAAKGMAGGPASGPTVASAMGKAIHLDASQRLVYAGAGGILCAEPTPDALQAYASSTGLGLSSPDRGAASLANAFATSAGSIGLHTQSITLMRESLYRLCEAAYNGLLGPEQTVKMMMRSQDLMLSILAIEQLTGAVVARQVVLATGGSASAAANIANTQATLDAARKNEKLQKEALDAANAQQEKLDAALAAAKKEVDDETAAQKGKTADAAAEKKLADLKTKAKTAEAAQTKGAADVAAAEESYKAAQQATLAIEQNFNAALAGGTANVDGVAKLGAGASQSTITAETAKVIADASVEIVYNAVSRGRLVDTCTEFLSRERPKAGPDGKVPVHPMDAVCVNALNAYVESVNQSLARRKNGEATSAAGGDAKKPNAGHSAGAAGVVPGANVRIEPRAVPQRLGEPRPLLF